MTPTRRLRHAGGRRPGVHVTPYDADLAFTSRCTTPTRRSRHAARRRPGVQVTPHDADPAFASRQVSGEHADTTKRPVSSFPHDAIARSASSRV